ncbi:MAG: serine protease, partial [Bacteroidota bacterium]
GRYDSEFPYQACSQQLEEIGESVQRINTMTSYRTYSFLPDESVTLDQVTPALLRLREQTSFLTDSEVAGSATVVASEGRRIALLTCAHIVDFPDTLISYYAGEDRKPSRYIKNIALKKNQAIFLGSFLQGGTLRILAIDRQSDIALIGASLEERPPIPYSVFNYPVGRARELEWGTFVYLFGYPAGYKIVTKGIVSSPNRDRQGSFLIDAVLAGGASGGIALAIRDGVPNFELVGMVSTLSGHTWHALVPSPSVSELNYSPNDPYDGPMFIDRKRDIQYGIIQVIPIESIVSFVERHRAALLQRGFKLTTFGQTAKAPL